MKELTTPDAAVSMNADMDNVLRMSVSTRLQSGEKLAGGSGTHSQTIFDLAIHVIFSAFLAQF